MNKIFRASSRNCREAKRNGTLFSKKSINRPRALSHVLWLRLDPSVSAFNLTRRVRGCSYILHRRPGEHSPKVGVSGIYKRNAVVPRARRIFPLRSSGHKHKAKTFRPPSPFRIRSAEKLQKVPLISSQLLQSTICNQQFTIPCFHTSFHIHARTIRFLLFRKKVHLIPSGLSCSPSPILNPQSELLN